jgi:GTP-binding protein HflX
MEAFAATLEELHDADLLLHMADATSRYLEKQIAAVEEILANLSLQGTPTLLVLNKTDLLEPGEVHTLSKRTGGVAISALYPPSLLKLMEKIEGLIWPRPASLKI